MVVVGSRVKYKPRYHDEYTVIVQDMIDEIGTGDDAYDQVTGYTIRQLEDALNSADTWNEWRDNIISRYKNETSSNLPALFNYWHN